MMMKVWPDGSAVGLMEKPGNKFVTLLCSTLSPYYSTLLLCYTVTSFRYSVALLLCSTLRPCLPQIFIQFPLPKTSCLSCYTHATLHLWKTCVLVSLMSSSERWGQDVLHLGWFWRRERGCSRVDWKPVQTQLLNCTNCMAPNTRCTNCMAPTAPNTKHQAHETRCTTAGNAPHL